MSSPCTWGLTERTRWQTGHLYEFPMYVGINRHRRPDPGTDPRVPHVRGD